MSSTITTTGQIMKALSLSYLVYDNFKEAWYLNWCQHYAKSTAISLRALVAHDGLRNWFHDQWNAQVDRQFLKDNSEFLRLNSPGELQEIYFTYPSKLQGIYPKAILEIIKIESHEIIAQRRQPLQQS